MVRNCSFKLFCFPIITRKNVEAAISSLGAARSEWRAGVDVFAQGGDTSRSKSLSEGKKMAHSGRHPLTDNG